MQKTVTQSTSEKALRILSLIALLLLLFEFVFGMLVNLFVQIPSPLPGSTPAGSQNVLGELGWALRQTNTPVLVVHVVVGLTLVVISLAAVILAFAARRGPWVTVALVGAVGLIIATLSGANFVESGAARSSLVMSLGFLLALIAYALGLYFSRPSRP